MTRRDDDPLRGLRPPPPPVALRTATLAAAELARAAGAPPPVRPALIDRLWESRPLRWAWLAAVAALLAGHLALRPPPPPAVAVAPPGDRPAAVRLAAAAGGGTLGDWSRQPSRHAARLIDLERPPGGDLR